MKPALLTVNGRQLPKMIFFLTILLLGFWSLGRGQLLLNDDFTGLNTGNLAGQSSWIKSGIGSDAVVDNILPLSYPGYNGGASEYVKLQTPDVNVNRTYKTFTSTTLGTGTFYCSLLLNLSSATEAGDFFISLGVGIGTNFYVKLFAKSSGNGYLIGMTKLSNTTPTYKSTVLSYNQTYLIVFKIVGVNGSANDNCYLWINPIISSEPNINNADIRYSADGDPTTLGQFAFHNRSVSGPKGTCDAVKVAYGSTSAVAWKNLDAYSCTPITITNQPTATSACLNSSANLIVTATGATSYQWYTNTNASNTGGTIISDAISASYSPATTTVGTTYYYVVVSNLCAIDTSDAVAYTVNQTPIALPVSPASAIICANAVQQLSVNSGNLTTTLFNDGFETYPSLNYLPSGLGIIVSSNSTYFNEGSKSVQIKNTNNPVRTTSATDNSYVQQASIDLSRYSSAQLAFSHICALEGDALNTRDAGYVQYSTDGGTTWTTFSSNSYVSSGKLVTSVTGTRVSGIIFSSGSYADWQAQFNNESSTPGTGPATSLWKTEIINIPAAALSSTQFKVRFQVTNDGSIAYYGWLIDNIKIIGTNSITWSPTSGLYTDANTTSPYTGTSSAIVYAKPTSTITYTATNTSNIGCQSTSSSVLTIQPAAIWKGSTSTDWNNASNWCSGTVPVSGEDVIIEAVSNQPLLTSDVNIGALTLGPNVSLNIGTKALTLNGAITNNGGSINAGSGTVIFAGDINQNIPANVFTGSIHNLTIYKNLKGEEIIINANTTITGALNLTKGILVVKNNRIEINGTFNRSEGVIDASKGTISFGGLTLIAIPSNTFASSINDMIVASGSNVMLNDNVSIETALTVNGLLTPSPNVVISGSGSLKGTGTIQVTAANGDGTNDFSSQYTLNIGSLANLTIEYTGAAAQNATGIMQGNITINNSNGVSLVEDATVNGRLTLNTGALSINGHTLTLNGAIAYPQNSTGTLKGSNTSNLIVSGIAGTLNFSSPGVLKNFTVKSGATASLGTALSIAGGATSGTLIVNGTLNTNNHLTLSSTWDGTASVGSSSGTISGNVTVERYIPNNGNRAWRLLTAPVSGTTINSSWQEDATSGAINNPNPGFGTLITGQAQGASAKAATNGYDFWPAIANSSSSIRHYAGTLTSGSWVAFPSITGMDISTYPAYLLFVRGDRSVFAADGSVKATTLRATGILNQGPQSATLYGSNVQGYSLVGNPYPSTIDVDKIFTRHSNKLKSQFWRWDANAGSYGGYTLVKKDNGNYYTIPLPFTGNSINSSTAQYIESGQGFFVQPLSEQTTTTAFDIQETDKVTSVTSASPFRRKPLMDARLFINLNQYVTSDSSVLADGVLAIFSKNADTSQNVVKLFNTGENLGLSRGNTVLTLEAHRPTSRTDTLRLKLWNTSQRKYQLQCKSENWLSGVKAYLVDNYLKVSTPVNLTGEVTTVDFTIDANVGSAAQDRFMVVFKYTGELPATSVKMQTDKLKFTSANKAFINVYPNPVHKGKIINVQIANIAAGNYQLSLYDGSGKQFLTKKIICTGNNRNDEVGLPQAIAQGVYYLKLTGTNGHIIKQIPVTVIK